MTHREPEPIDTIKRCPRCASQVAVTPTTEHERDRTGCGWWCDRCRMAFTGTATEFQTMQAKAIADAAARMTTTPTRPTEGHPT